MEDAMLSFVVGAVSSIMGKLHDSYFGGDITSQEIRKLQTIILPKIQTVIEAAETIPTNKLKPWLMDLKAASFEAEDVLDLYEYEAIKNRVMQEEYMSGSDEEQSNYDGVMNDEETLHQACAAAAQASVIVLKAWLKKKEEDLSRRITRVPTTVQQPNREYDRNAHMQHILEGSSTSCVDYLRMRKEPFMQLCNMIRELGLLKDSIHVNVEEQVAMFLHIVGHKAKNKVMRVDFIRSGETVSRYFNQVLRAIFRLRDRYMKQPSGSNVPPEILSNPSWYPYFKDCIGMIDGTHVDAIVPLEMVGRFWGRKGVTQNILAACSPNKLFTYVLAGWEGSVNDYAILKDALSLPPGERLHVPEGKYYLCDAGYTTGHGFISPYRGVRYHLKEHIGRTPKNRRELFNLRHSSLRTKIEACFGILKNRFKILTAKSHHPFPTQVKIVLACAILHNYIVMVDPSDDLLNQEVETEGDEGEDVTDEESSVDFDPNQSQSQLRENRDHWKERRDEIAWKMWLDYCKDHRGGDLSESAM